LRHPLYFICPAADLSISSADQNENHKRNVALIAGTIVNNLMNAIHQALTRYRRSVSRWTSARPRSAEGVENSDPHRGGDRRRFWDEFREGQRQAGERSALNAPRSASRAGAHNQ
jgi:hypothetical protein